MQTIIILPLLLLLSLSPSLRLEVRPKIAFRPDTMSVQLYLTGEEDGYSVALYDEDGFMVRSSSADLQGEKLVSFFWHRPPTGALTIVAATYRDGKVMERREVAVIYMSVVGF